MPEHSSTSVPMSSPHKRAMALSPASCAKSDIPAMMKPMHQANGIDIGASMTRMMVCAMVNPAAYLDKEDVQKSSARAHAGTRGVVVVVVGWWWWWCVVPREGKSRRGASHGAAPNGQDACEKADCHKGPFCETKKVGVQRCAAGTLTTTTATVLRGEDRCPRTVRPGATCSGTGPRHEP